MALTFAYARISRDHDKSVSVEDQIRRVNAYAEATDRKITGTFIDRDASGRNLDRPRMTEMLALLNPGDTVMVFKLDRLTRSVRDLGLMLEKGYQIVSVSESLDTQSASGRLVVNILATVAQWEREVTVERTTNALAYKRKNNNVYGSIPYGYQRVGDVIVPDEGEQLAILDLKDWHEAGYSNAVVAALLNERYPRACRGQKWYPATVRSIIKSLKYADNQASAV